MFKYLKVFQLVFFLFCLSIVVSGQSLVAPYMCNNELYGLANEEGEVVVKCQYTHLQHINQFDMIRANSGDKYTIYTKFGVPVGKGKFESPVMPTTIKIRTDKSEIIDTVVMIECRISGHYFVLNPDDHSILLSGIRKSVKDPLSGYNKPIAAPIIFYGKYSAFMQEDGKMNVVDRSFNPLLEKGYDYLTTIDDNALGIYDQGGFHLFDINTKKKSDHTYDNISATQIPNVYITNSDPYDYKKTFDTEPLASLININGNLLQDTKYHFLKDNSGSVIIAKLYKDYYLLDAAGIKITSNPYEYIAYLSNNYYAAIRENQTYVLDSKGVEISGPFKKVENIKAGNYEYICIYRDDVINILNPENLKTLVTTKGRNVTKTIIDHIVSVEVNYVERKGLNVKTKKETKLGNSFLLQKKYSSNIFEINKDSTFALYDADLNELIVDITGSWSEHPKDSTILLVKNKDEKIYTYFNINTKKTSTDGIADPRFLQHPEAAYIKERNDKLLLRNGEVKLKTEYDVKQSIAIDGKFISIAHYLGSEHYYLFDQDFYNIIPAGFWIPKKFYNYTDLSYGLAPVFNEFDSGVIDMNGNWVIPPSPFKYRIVSPNLILQENVNDKSNREQTLYVLKKGKWLPYSDLIIMPLQKEQGIIVNSGYLNNIEKVESFALDFYGNDLIPKDKGYLMLKNNNLLRLVGNKEEKSSTIYTLDGTKVCNSIYEIHDIRDYYMTAKQGDLFYLLDTLCKEVVQSSTSYNATLFPDFGVYLDKDGKNYFLETVDGNRIHPDFIERASIIKIGTQDYLQVIGDGLTTLYDKSLKPITVLKSVKYNGRSYFPGFSTFETKDRKIIYLSNKTMKLLVN